MITPQEFLKKQHEKYPGDYGLCPPPTTTQEALDALSEHFLGKGWYTTMPMGAQQVNTQIVCEILDKYAGHMDKKEGRRRFKAKIRKLLRR